MPGSKVKLGTFLSSAAQSPAAFNVSESEKNPSDLFSHRTAGEEKQDSSNRGGISIPNIIETTQLGKPQTAADRVKERQNSRQARISARSKQARDSSPNSPSYKPSKASTYEPSSPNQ